MKNLPRVTLSMLQVQHDYYTTRQIAEIYHVSQQTVRQWIEQGILKADRLSDSPRSHYRIFPQIVDECELRREELIEASRRYWPRLLRDIKKKV